MRYLLFGIAILLGLAAGLYYGWVVNPVKVENISPDILREDFRADYVLMVAEIYQSEQNPEQAMDRLTFLRANNPLTSIEQALSFAAESGYAETDFALLSELDKAVRAWDPSLEYTPTP